MEQELINSLEQGNFKINRSLGDSARIEDREHTTRIYYSARIE